VNGGTRKFDISALAWVQSWPLAIGVTKVSNGAREVGPVYGERKNWVTMAVNTRIKHSQVCLDHGKERYGGSNHGKRELHFQRLTKKMDDCLGLRLQKMKGSIETSSRGIENCLE